MFDFNLISLFRKAATWILHGLSVLFANRAGTWVAAAMSWLGITFGSVTYLLDPLINQVQGILGDADSVAMGWLGYLKVDIAMTMILSAVTIRYGFNATKLFIKRA